ncbi:alpha/beta fold hydrolase [Halalkalicoccus jeotgali]|uniref:Alpha/beta hydrolase fold protein n=1 Tax=Halalkalicoccus jeotgali (strain DSM 18796 / CECT 7217 / JCM 14584 / KCTC 4019 / B3) TaxID=795797 RepID=D8JCB9_HALJB|nr:alpha/beta hydrolase [Halalkalicoccus jeotgali]ADJ17026.1 alpha/beta hydrolase fold protein [Halalkalicoccus jeotgali B3]ELY38811.1 alpha/beta hydrolase fold protein [Halalkalicoccus jeotgali B3]
MSVTTPPETGDTVITTDQSLLTDYDVESTYRDINDVQLHVVAAGEPDAPLVVLLHGHPDFWYGWRDQIRSLAEAGFRVVVPDQRGCNLSEAPDGIDAYRQSELSADICELIHSESRESAHVVGHDFGGFVAWNLALRHPSMVDRLGIFNVPHPTVYRDTLRSSPQQIARSWYVWFYQVPKLPEWMLTRNDMANMVDSLEITSHPGTFDEETIACYKAAWRHTGITPRINWYRGFRRSDSQPRDTVTQPTLICWGGDDIALLPSMAQKSVDYCEDGKLQMFPDASHWVHLERDEVSEVLRCHLS